MTRLHELRKRLSRLRRRRQHVRWGTAYTALALAALWMLAALFLLDWWLEMDKPLRVICVIACAGVGVWAFRRYALPWLGFHEDDLDMALLVERAEHIDSDLIAAVQFESPQAPEWGSVQLEQAVIDRVAATGPRLNVMKNLSRRELARRSILLGVTIAVWAVVAVALPGHVSTFFQRLVLGSQHYPTDTVIESIVILRCDPGNTDPGVSPSGGNVSPSGGSNADEPSLADPWKTAKHWEVDPVYPGETDVPILYGQRVRFQVQCKDGSVLPEKGKVELTVARGNRHHSIELEPVLDESGDNSGLYVGELERLRDDVHYQIYLGDAWTDPGLLTVAELP